MKCYLCEANTKHFLHKLGYDLYRCPECALISTKFTEPYETFVKRFYSKGYFTGDPRFSAFFHYEEDKACITRNTAQSLTKIRKIKPGGKLLDVGCAMGFFVEQAGKAGFDAYGFDPSEYAVTKAVKRVPGKISKATVGSASYPKKSFDVITMFDVFEHLIDPVGDVRKLRSLLKPDGIILIATGNTSSLAAKILRNSWTFYSPPQHLHFFNRENLTTVLERAGFIPDRWFVVNKWLSLGYLLHLAHTCADYPFTAELEELISRIDSLRKVPVPVPLRDNMVVVARNQG